MPEAKTDKRRLIKDPVWGNLEIFSWESQLLNHFLFNRLHNIVQNSSAYKVYPGLKYSRFLHTVGVSHVATNLFLNAAAKAEDEALVALNAEAEKIGALLTEETRARIAKSILRSFPCSPPHAVMLAAIRVAAFIHDIGHLPFSHVFENAMDGFRQGEFGEDIKLTELGKQRRDELNALLEPHEKAGDPDVKLHELLGKMFVEVLQSFFEKVPELSGLLKAALLIFKTNDLPIAKGFIVGTIDADRIDFVRRDGFFSGLFNSSVDFGRIFAFFELAKNEETGLWLPRPSPRTVSETEKLLLERFLDYKYIIVHHRVHLYDEIMENILVRLMADGTFEKFVTVLCKLLKFTAPKHLLDHGAQIELLRSLLTEFDDPWAEIEIRHVYSNLKATDHATTKMLFEAYVEDRHSFRSAFKTDEDFQRSCAKYAPELMKQNPNAVRNAFGASKYILQHDLGKKLKRTVLIGSTDKKLSYGIRNDLTAKFHGVSDLHGFLIQKKIHSLTFNFWYSSKDNGDGEDTESEHEQVISEALPFLQEVVTKQLQLGISP
jgi:HD superfamily phosphohydrolase